MNRCVQILAWAAFAALCQESFAETYKCAREGKTVYSDLPCSAGAARVDGGADKVDRDQRRQAEAVNRANRRQLSELEYQASRDRYGIGRAAILPPR